MQSDAAMRRTGDDLLEALSDVGLRATRARRCIAECLEMIATSEDDFTIDGLYAMAHEHDRRVGRATVYRAVETLLRLNLVDRITFADGAHRYRVRGREHEHYITCALCRRVVAFKFCAPEELFTRVAKETGFVVEGHALDVYGRCPDCARHLQ